MGKHRENVIAVFDDARALEGALRALHDAGLGEQVRHVDDASDAGRTRAAAAQQQVVDQQGEMARVAPRTGSLPDLDLSPFGEAGEFFRDARQDGGKLVTLAADDPQRVAEILEREGATRVHATG